LKEIAIAVSRKLGFEGRTSAISTEEGIQRLGAEMAQFALASNSRVRARAARTLGWRPRNDDLLDGIETGKYSV
jgi:hypothetical protein